MTANLIQQQDMLKELSDKQLARQMQYPSGDMPLFLISTEAKRRADLRQRFKIAQAEPPEKTTVQEDLLRSILTGETPPTGIAQNLGQRPQTPPFQGRLPQIDPRQAAPQAQVGVPPTPGSPQPQMLAQAPVGIMQGRRPQGLPGSIQAPRGFAGGGIVRGFANGVFFPTLAPHAHTQQMTLQRRSVPEARERITGIPIRPPHYPHVSPRLNVRESALYKAPSDAELATEPENVDYSQPLPPRSEGTSIVDVPPEEAELFTTPPVSATNAAVAQGKLTAWRANNPNVPGAGLPSDFRKAPQRKLGPVLPGLDTSRLRTNISPETVAPYTPLPMPEFLPLANDVNVSQIMKTELARLRGGPDPYAKREERLSEREADIERDAERDPWLALAEGGFRTAAGDSQYAMQNIGEGGQAGLAAYITSKKDREGREERTFDARSALEDARETRDGKLRQIARDTANDQLGKQERANAIVSAHHQYNVQKRNIDNARLKGVYDAGVIQQKLNLDIARENRINAIALLREQNQVGRDSAEREIRRLDIVFETNKAQWDTEKEAALVAAKQRRDDYLLKDRRLVQERDALLEIDEGRKDRETRIKAALIAAKPAAVRTAEAALQSRPLADMLVRLSGQHGKTAKVMRGNIKQAWLTTLKQYDDGGAPDPRDIPDLRTKFVALLAPQGFDAATAGALFDGMARNGGMVGAGAGNLNELYEINPDTGNRRRRQ